MTNAKFNSDSGGSAATSTNSGPRGIRLRQQASAGQAGPSQENTGPRGSGPSRGNDDPITGGTGATPSYPSRHRPAHLPNLDRHNQPIIVFLTVCTKDRQPVLATPPMHALLVRAWQAARQWRVGHYLIMPDHVHIFCSPALQEAENIDGWAGYWKALVARATQGHGPLASSNLDGPGGIRLRQQASAGQAGPSHPTAGKDGAGGTAPSRPILGGTTATPTDLRPNPGGTTATSSPFGPRGSGPSQKTGDTFWQRDCWDTQLRDASHYSEKWQYVVMNPVRKGWVNQPESWPFAGTLNDLRW